MHIFANSFLFFLMFFQFSAVHAAVIDSTIKNGVIYFLHDMPAKVTRHNFIQNSWLSEITIEKGAKRIHIDGYYIYAMGHSNLYRYDITTKSKTEIGNDLFTYTSVHTDGDLLITVSNQLSEPSVINTYNKGNLTPITVNFPIMGYASEATISPNQNRLYINMTQNAAGSTRIDYSHSGAIVSHRNNFFDNGSSARNKSWLSPSEETIIYENGSSFHNLLDSGGYSSSNITNPISGVVFLENKQLVITSGNTITLYDENMNKIGDKEFKNTIRSVTSNNELLYIYSDNSASTGDVVLIHSLASLRGNDKIQPKGLSYSVDDAMVDKSGNVLILSKKNKSIFIWDARKQDYINSIPLFSSPYNITYSPVLHRIYVAYSNGLISKIDLDNEKIEEEPFFKFGVFPTTLTMAGEFLFTSDIGISIERSYQTIRPDGSLAGSLKDSTRLNYINDLKYIWNREKQLMYCVASNSAYGYINSISINENGTLHTNVALGAINSISPIQLEQTQIYYGPCFASEDASNILLGSGKIYDTSTQTLRAISIPHKITSAEWFGNDIVTMISQNDSAQIQYASSPSLKYVKTKQINGIPVKLIKLSDEKFCVITQPYWNGPQIDIYDKNFNIIHPDEYSKPLLEVWNYGSNVDHLTWIPYKLATKYIIESKSNKGVWSVFKYNAGNNNSLLIKDGIPTRTYRVKAVGEKTSSEWSNEVVVNKDPPPPRMFELSALSEHAIKITVADGTDITKTLAFSPTVIIQYRIFGTSRFSAPIALYEKDKTATIENLRHDTNYEVSVYAINRFGKSTVVIKQVKTLVNMPVVPGDFKHEAISSSQIRLSWRESSNADSYLLERRSSSMPDWQVVGRFSSPVKSYLDRSLEANATYDYRLSAINAVGSTAYIYTSGAIPVIGLRRDAKAVHLPQYTATNNRAIHNYHLEPARLGTYEGIIYTSDSYCVGKITSLKISKNGVFSGRLLLYGTSTAMKGRFNDSGSYYLYEDDASFVMNVSYMEDRRIAITGKMSFNYTLFTFTLYRTIGAIDQVGSYTAAHINHKNRELPSMTSSIKIRKDGSILTNSTMFDGVKATAASRLCEGDVFDLFLPPKNTSIRGWKQMMGGSFQFRDLVHTSDFDGVGNYAYLGVDGFYHQDQQTVGSKFEASKTANPMTGTQKDEVVVVNVRYPTDRNAESLSAIWTTKNVISGKDISGSLAPVTGTCNLKFSNLYDGTYNFSGVLLQKQGIVIGEGFNSKTKQAISVHVIQD